MEMEHGTPGAGRQPLSPHELLWPEPCKGEVDSCSDATDDALEAAEESKRCGDESFRQGWYEEAIEAYSEAIQLRPQEHVYWLNRSIARRQLQQWALAEV